MKPSAPGTRCASAYPSLEGQLKRAPQHRRVGCGWLSHAILCMAKNWKLEPRIGALKGSRVLRGSHLPIDVCLMRLGIAITPE